MDRNSHGGKSPEEKAFYFKMLKFPTPPQPTLEEHEIDQTNKEDESLFVGTEAKPHGLIPYEPKKESHYKEVLIGIVCAVVSGIVLFYFTNLNRDIGTILERVDNLIISTKEKNEKFNETDKELRNDIQKTSDAVNDLKISIEVIKEKIKE